MRSIYRKIINQMMKSEFMVRVFVFLIVFFGFLDVYSQDTIIGSGHTWKYLDNGTIDIENISWFKSDKIIGVKEKHLLVLVREMRLQ